MLPLSFADDDVRVGRPVMVDDHGSQVPSEDYAWHDLPGCVVQPLSTEEQMAFGDASTAIWQVLAPAGTDVRRLDVVELPRETGQFRVVAEPQTWPSPLDDLDHVVFRCERWTQGAS